MISRLTFVAVSLAVLTTASLAFAAESRHDARTHAEPAPVTKTVQLERVVITAKRLPQGAL
jgi:Flp pilus assembly protein CpaB